jgi:hypothetical protein
MRYDVRISVDINRIRREALDKIAETNPPLSRGLIIKYEPTIEYLIPAITAAFAGVGVSCEYANGIFSKWFTHLPEIRKKYKITPNSPIKQYENALSDLYHLYIKMARRYRTLHIDEILTLRLLPQILPQPIAEAVADCIHGVMDRRYMHRGYMNYYDWTNEGAFWNEVSITHYDMFGESEVTRASKPRQESWEACAIELHEERQDIIRAKMSTRKKSSSSSESSHDYERTSCWAGDDGW